MFSTIIDCTSSTNPLQYKIPAGLYGLDGIYGIYLALLMRLYRNGVREVNNKFVFVNPHNNFYVRIKITDGWLCFCPARKEKNAKKH